MENSGLKEYFNLLSKNAINLSLSEDNALNKFRELMSEL